MKEGKKRKNTFKKPGCLLLHGQWLWKAAAYTVSDGGTVECQSATGEKLHRKHRGRQRTSWWGAGEESGMMKNATHAIAVGAGVR